MNPKEKKIEVRWMEYIRLTNEKNLKRINKSCKPGDPVIFMYRHHTNHLSSFFRFCSAKFLRYCNCGMRVVIKRTDCMNPSRVRIKQVYTYTKTKPKEKKIRKYDYIAIISEVIDDSRNNQEIHGERSKRTLY